MTKAEKLKAFNLCIRTAILTVFTFMLMKLAAIYFPVMKVVTDNVMNIISVFIIIASLWAIYQSYGRSRLLVVVSAAAIILNVLMITISVGGYQL